MHYGQSFTSLRGIMTTANTCGATIPKAIAAEYATLDGLADRVRHYASDELADNVGAAVLDALADDRDPTDDPAVQRALTAKALIQSAGSLDGALGDRAQAFIEAHALAIIEAHRRPFDKAAAAITDAHDFLGDVDLTDTRTILGTGGTAATSWAQANDAQRTIATIVKAWKLLSQLTGQVPLHHKHQLLITVDAPPAEYIEHSATVATPWDAVRHGWTFALATPDTYAARLDALTAEQATRDAHAEQSFGRAYQRVAGIAS